MLSPLDFIIEKPINSGRFGIVHKAFQISQKRTVAVKMLRKLRHDMSYLNNKAMIKREFENWNQLKNNSNIVNFIGKYETDSHVCLVSEYEKPSNFIDEYGVLLGIAQCHAKNILHGDIKPENIINSKLCDFGTSQVCKHHASGLFSKQGTPAYMAPEILNNEEYGKSADIYSFGLMFKHQNPELSLLCLTLDKYDRPTAQELLRLFKT